MNAELQVAYVWWEGLSGWLQILSSNNWPANREITTIWQVKNTGNVAAAFEVRFMGKTASAVINPGWTVSFLLYPVTPSPGTYSYTLEIIAGGQVVATAPLEVITYKEEAMEAQEFVREWDLLWTTHGEILNYQTYLNWRSFILGEVTYPDPVSAANSDLNSGFITYYAYQRLYGWIVYGNPDFLVADKYNIHQDGGTPVGKYKLTTTVSPPLAGNGVTKNPDETGIYDPGTVVTLTAVAASGYRFKSWGGDASGTANPTTITMDKDKMVTALFEQVAAGMTDVMNMVTPVIVLGLMAGMMSAMMPKKVI